MPRGGFFSVDSLRGVWVLIVDSNPRGRETLGEILSYCGALVTLMASDDDDFAFIRQVRGLKPEDGGVVPAIAIARDGDDDLARSRGYQAYLRPPLDPWELCRLVSSMMTVR